MQVGRVSEVWLYPVKSMGGQQVDSIELDELGAIGDRSWSMLDAATGDVAYGKRFPKLMDLAASYVNDRPQQRVYGSDVPAVRINFPDANNLSSDDGADKAVSDFAGGDLRLSPLEPAENRDHYRWSAPLDEEALKKILGIGAGEDIPDLSSYDENLLAMLAEYYAPPGTYNDMAPIHAMTSASLRHMSEVAGENFDVRRFRPNFLIETNDDIDGLAEFTWVGKQLRVGEVTLSVDAKTVRCSMPARPQAPFEILSNPKIARALYEETGRFLGAYLSVVEAGTIQVGDPVTLL